MHTHNLFCESPYIIYVLSKIIPKVFLRTNINTLTRFKANWSKLVRGVAFCQILLKYSPCTYTTLAVDY